MKKDWWIALSAILLIIDIFLSIELKNSKNQSIRLFSFEILNPNISPPYKKSFLYLLVYFSEKDCEACRAEAFYWNKLYVDLTREELTVLGLTDKKELIDVIKDRYQILFPMIYDQKAIIKKKFDIDFGPFRIILDSRGKVLYFSPVSSEKSAQENFYFEVIEHLGRVRIRDIMRTTK